MPAPPESGSDVEFFDLLARVPPEQWIALVVAGCVLILLFVLAPFLQRVFWFIAYFIAGYVLFLIYSNMGRFWRFMRVIYRIGLFSRIGSVAEELALKSHEILTDE